MNQHLSEDIIIGKVNQILADLFEISTAELAPAKHLYEDFGLDSLDAIDMVIQFQKEFKIKPSNEELQSIRTVGDVYKMVGRYCEKSQTV